MGINKQSAGHVQATLEVSDLEIGAVEVKDGDSDVRLDVELVTLKNAGYTQSEAGAHVDLTAVRTAIELIDHLITAGAGNVDAGTQRVTIATDDVNLAAIMTAVEVLDNAISGQEMLIAGGATQANDVKMTLDGEAITSIGTTISQTPTVTAGAYSANDAVGGLLTFANAARVSTGGGVIKDLIILDDAGQDVEMECWVFDSTFTAMSDNAAWAPSEADLRKLVAIISTSDGAWFAAGTPSAARVEVSQRYDCTGTSLFGQLVTRGTPTFAATDDITVRLGLLQD